MTILQRSYVPLKVVARDVRLGCQGFEMRELSGGVGRINVRDDV